MLLPLSEVSNFETLFDKWQRALCKIYLYLTSSMKTDFWGEKEVERLSPTFAALISFVASQVLDLLHCRETQRTV